MLSQEEMPSYLGCPCSLQNLRALNDNLNAKVVDEINKSQELLMLNTFGQETNDHMIKKCFQERMAEVAAWRWVLEDLNKRLTEAIEALHYEHKALYVVINRVQNEIYNFSKEGSRPGVLCPLSDNVEDAIHQEHKFLRDQKKYFEKMVDALTEQIKKLEKTMTRIETDVLNKEKAIIVDETCSKLDNTSGTKLGRKKIKKRSTPLSRWENRCASLKRAGLRALNDALVTRQQVRGARIHLSISAQSHAAKADSALRRRLQRNRVRLQELSWQKDEAVRDLLALNEEQTAIEKNILDTMEQERLVEVKLADRSQKPLRESIKDEVQRKLKDELARIRHFLKQLRKNLNRINSLQNNLVDAIHKIDNFAEDILKVVCLDEERIKARTGEELLMGTSTTGSAQTTPQSGQTSPQSAQTALQQPAQNTTSQNITIPSDSISSAQSKTGNGQLSVILEEDEGDDYPFDD